MGSTNAISTAVDDCARAFLSLAGSLEKPTRFAEQVAAESILDEFDRFKLWAGNIAAHRKGRRSLENRLRDATRLKEETYGLLTLLSDALKKALSIVEGECIPWDEETYSDSESEPSDDETSNPDLQGNTELKQLYASTKTTVTSLMRISMAIREPALNSQSRSIDKSHFQQHDIQHVQNKFPSAPGYLTERLGHAISSRRQYLAYRETHHEKLTKGIDKLGLEAARSEFTTNSTEATRLQRTGSFNILDDDNDTASQTSYATSINATVRAPKLPKEAREKDYYDCPFCFALIAIHTTAAWKLYDSRHAWFAHELEAHHSSFQCVQGCLEAFQTESDFEGHIKSKHEDLAAPAVYSALRRASAKTPGINEETTCKLCARRMTLRKMQKHLGHHHEQLALFALPANLDDIEDDPDEGNQDSVLKVEGDREEEGEDLTDTSDTSETEELVQRSDDLHKDPVSTFYDQDSEIQYHPDSGHRGLVGQHVYNSSHGNIDGGHAYLGDTNFDNDNDDGDDEDEDEDNSDPFANSRQVHIDRVTDAKNQANVQEKSDSKASQQSPANREDLIKALEGAGEEGLDISFLGNVLTTVGETAQATRDEAERRTSVAQQRAIDALEAKKRDREVVEVEEEPYIRQLSYGEEDTERTIEAPVKRGEAERERKVAQQAAVDDYNREKAKEEKEAEEERNRIIYEYERKKEREEPILLRIEEEKQRQKDKEEYEVFLSKQKDKENVEKARRVVEDRDLDEIMRKRLEEFDFHEDQIQTMIQSEQTKTGGKGKAAISTNDVSLNAPQPTYAKVAREHLDVETLHYYDILYEYDEDPNYIIVLRELNEREADILFEHTRRLRSNNGKRLFIEAEGSGNRTSEKSGSEVERSERSQPQKLRMPSVSDVHQQQPDESLHLDLSGDHSEKEIAEKQYTQQGQATQQYSTLSPFGGLVNPFPADRASELPLYIGNSDNEYERSNTFETSSAAKSQERDTVQIPITETKRRASFSSRAWPKAGYSRITSLTPKYKKGDHVQMGVVENGQRMKGVFTIHGAEPNNRGWFEYSLADTFTGKLYKNGAAVHEKDLKPGT
ncbi:metal ion binding [Ascochyta rabiei]|uniref:Metal ion binding n=1 Tax=Didymella rabiei TaxID=5454 RepID=A0A163K073_DIDRA|nr:metal ion binding [Ascochyta rabiei]